jgi:hypothetical protein
MVDWRANTKGMGYVEAMERKHTPEQWFKYRAKDLSGTGKVNIGCVEREYNIKDKKRAFCLALCAAGGDVERAVNATGVPWRHAQAWARSVWFQAWRDAYVAETTQAVTGRLPRLWEQVFQNAYGSAVPVLEACLQDDPVTALKGLDEAQQGQIQDFTCETDKNGHKTVRVKLANRDRSNEMALSVLNGTEVGRLKNADRPIFSVNVIVAGDEPGVGKPIKAAVVVAVPEAKLVEGTE